MGFSLSEDSTSTGFSGPYLLGIEHGLWASKQIASLDLLFANGKSLLTDLKSSEQNYFPGKLENQLHFESFDLKSVLVFTSEKSAIISTTLTNTQNQNLSFTPQWKGTLFDRFASLKNYQTHIKVPLESHQEIYIIPLQESSIENDSNAYIISLKSCTLKPGESIQFSVEIQYHPNQKNIQDPIKQSEISKHLHANKQLAKSGRSFKARWDFSLLSLQRVSRLLVLGLVETCGCLGEN